LEDSHLHEIGLSGSTFAQSKQLSAVSNQLSASYSPSGNYV
jgi:hypothetical protein